MTRTNCELFIDRFEFQEKIDLTRTIKKVVNKYLENKLRSSEDKELVYSRFFANVEKETGFSKKTRRTKPTADEPSPFKHMIENWGRFNRTSNTDFAIATYYWFRAFCKSPQFAKMIDDVAFGKDVSFETYFKTNTHRESNIKKDQELISGQENTSVKQLAPPTRFEYPAPPTDEETENPFRAGYIQYHGRNAEQKLLNEFITQQKNNADLSLWAVSGPSGSGKTSLVQHWMKHSQAMPENEWEQLVLGYNYAKSHGDKRSFWEGTPEDINSGWTPKHSTLIVIDYLHIYREALDALIRRCEDLKDSGKLNHPVRVLLIDHMFPDSLHDITTNERLRSIQDNMLNISHICYKNKALTLETMYSINSDGTKTEIQDQGLEEIIPLILSEAAGEAVSQGIKDKAEQHLKDTTAAYYPLFAILLGYALNQAEKRKEILDFTAWNRRTLIEQYFKAKRLPWSQSEPQKTEEKERWQHRLWASACVVSATMRRGITYELLHSCIPDSDDAPDIDHPTLKEYCRAIIAAPSEENELASFEPDILGETYALLFMKAILDNKKALRPFKKSFFQMLSCGSKEVQYKDSEEFTGVMSRIARNLCNDNQEDAFVQEHWEILMTFLKVSNFHENTLMTQVTSSALTAIALVIQRHIENNNKYKKKFLARLKKVLENVDISILCQSYNNEFIDNYLICSISYAEWLHEFSDNNEASDKIWERIATIEKFSNLSALDYASNFGFLHVVNKLILEGADVHHSRTDKITPLMLASFRGHHEVVKKLVAEGSDVNSQNFLQRAPLLFASQNGHLEIVKYLIDEDAIVDFPADKQQTALLAASLNGHSEIVRYLINKGACVKHSDSEQRTALLHASLNGHLEIVKYLINRGACVNHFDDEKQTALHIASMNGHLRIAKYLIKHSKYLNLKDCFGLTALDYARKGKHQKIVDVLVSAGAK